MKKLKKVLLSVVALTLVAALSVAGTLAYLQSETPEKVNTFTANNVTVTLEEESGTSYNIIPGKEETKNPTVKVTATLPAYVFVEVTDATSAVTGKKLVEYKMADGWTALDEEQYPGVYFREVEGMAEEQVFAVLLDNKVTYPASLTNEDMLDADGKLRTDVKLSFKASAVQKEPFTSAADAYTGKDTVFTENLDEAAQAAAEGKPVEVQADVNKTYTEAGDTNKVLEPADGSSIDFQDNTLTIESASGQNGVQVSNGASTTLSNGTITMDKAYGTGSGVVSAYHAEVTLDNMTVINSGKEGVCVSAGADGGKVTLIESTVSGGGKYSPAVFCGDGSTVVIENSTIDGCIRAMSNARIELRGGDYTKASFDSESSSNNSIIVYSGKFSIDPSKSSECKVDSGSTVQNNGDGTYTVVSLDELTPVTVANADALNTALQTTGHVQLANDITLNEDLFVEVPNGVKVLLDLNGHVITGESKSTRNITNSGTMIIRDSSAAGTGEIRNSYAGAAGENGSFGLIDNYGKLTIESGTFTNVAHGFGSAIKNRNGASLTITGGTVRSEVDDSAAEGNVGAGNLLISSAGDLKISGGTFILKGTTKVTAIEVYDGSSATITNATITSSDSQAIQVWDSYVKITNAAITSEKSNVIEANGWSEVEIKNSTVTGGLYAPTYVDPEDPDNTVTPSITITSGTFTVNPAAVENCTIASSSTVTENNGTWTVTAG